MSILCKSIIIFGLISYAYIIHMKWHYQYMKSNTHDTIMFSRNLLIVLFHSFNKVINKSSTFEFCLLISKRKRYVYIDKYAALIH